MLLEMGERPSILSRGYAREIVEDGTVIVSDGQTVLADVARSGDEPLMLARQVPRAAVLVSPSRYVSGRVAESTLGCTVHVLDDGFQHFDLVRDIDLLVAPATLGDTRTLPFGRFREPLDAAAAADALLVEVEAPPGRAEALHHQSAAARGVVPSAVAHDAVPSALAQGFSPVTQDSAAQLAARLKVPIAFEFSRRIAGPIPDRPAFAFAGIARPERFFDDLERAGWRLTGRRAFADHHRYSDREIDDIAAAAAASGAQVMLTTEKDLVRLRPRANIVSVPLEVSLAPSFGPWLAERLRAARVPGGAV